MKIVKNIFDGVLGGVALAAMIIILVKSIAATWPYYLVLLGVGIIAFIEDLLVAEEDDEDE